MPNKEAEARIAAKEAQAGGDVDALPQYSATPSEGQGPTAESPFDFPSEEPPPAFAPTSTTSSSSSAPAPPHFRQPLAIPQITSDKTAPFLDAYAQPLLQYGITPESWRAFLATMSAFLAARVSERSLAHAADMGRHVTNVPKRFGQGSVEHAKLLGNNIRDNASRGNYVGAAMGVVGGSISLPIGTALRAVGAAVQLPGAALGAVMQKPKTPRERAVAYAAAANEEWLGMRGLQVQLVDTAELARISGCSVTRLLDLASASGDLGAAEQIDALKEYVIELELSAGSTLELGPNTLWLMVLQEDVVAPEAEGGKRRRSND